jgi:recombinational DNA repair ATPase RecF
MLRGELAAGRSGGQTGRPDSSLPVCLGQYDLGVLEEQTAVCYRAAGRPDVAISILEKKISAMPASLTRDRGHVTAKLAVAVAQARQPGPSRAAQLGMAATDTAQRTGSARIVRELHSLNSELAARWPERKETQTLHEALTRPSVQRFRPSAV